MFCCFTLLAAPHAAASSSRSARMYMVPRVRFRPTLFRKYWKEVCVVVVAGIVLDSEEEVCDYVYRGVRGLSHAVWGEIMRDGGADR